MNYPQKTVAEVFVLALLAAGCRTMPVPNLQTQQADAYAQHKEIGGLVIGIHPMTQKAEIVQNFDLNLLEEGLLPILVVAENRSASASFIIAKEQVFVLNATTGATNNSQSKEVGIGKAKTGRILSEIGSAAGTSSLGGSILTGVGAKLVSDTMMSRYNLKDKEFYSRTLEPGQKAQGFFYFQFPGAAPPSGSYRVVAQVKNTSTGEVTPFDFELNFNPTNQ